MQASHEVIFKIGRYSKSDYSTSEFIITGGHPALKESYQLASRTADMLTSRNHLKILVPDIVEMD